MVQDKTTIIGAGEIGRVLAKILEKDRLLEIWDKEPSRSGSRKTLVEAAEGADFVFLCVPTASLIEVVSEIAPYLKKSASVISLSKGLSANGQTSAEVLESLLPIGQPEVVIGGPMIAEEIMKNQRGVAVVAAKDEEVSAMVSCLFEKTLKVERTSDIAGVAMSGVLKNIYAIGLGIAEGLGMGSNLRGCFMVKALEEMTEVIEFFGGRKETVLGNAGLGDLFATASSGYSRNKEIGVELGRAGRANIKGEGFFSVSLLLERLGPKADNFSFLKAIGSVVADQLSAEETFNNIVGMRELP